MSPRLRARWTGLTTAFVVASESMRDDFGVSWPHADVAIDAAMTAEGPAHG